MEALQTESRARMLTLVFTDLAGSTALKAELGDHAVAELIARHRRQVERIAGMRGGRIVDWAGDGCFLTFEASSAAVLFGLELQQAHAAESDLPGVRVGIHSGEISETRTPGEPTLRIEGLAVDLAARIASLALPAQVLLSSTVFNTVRQRLRGDELGAEIHWLAHGEYELKGFDEPLDICEAGMEGMSPLQPPPGSEKAHRAVAPSAEETLGWRPAVGLHAPLREHWVLEKRLGEGGFGEVWLAIHEKTGAKRVFKYCFEIERVRGLKREVVLFRLLKESLGHREDIAQIIDWEFDRPPYFLESEYTEGGDVRDWAERHGGLDRIPLGTRLEIVAQAAVALGAAHSVGVLHKDIKPANILINEVVGKDKPRASLTDFGIGLITDPGALAAQGITAAGLTQTLVRPRSSTSDTGSGTRLYMAPEQLEGKPATTLSDVYSLGIVLYQMVIGDLTRGVAPGWERGIDDELLREDIALCVDGEPERRLKNADELAVRLRGLESRREDFRKRRAAHRRRRMLVISTVAGPVVTLLILVFAFQQTRLAGEANRLRIEAEEATEQAKQNAVEAERQRNDAIAMRAVAERRQYVSNVRLAGTLLDQSNVASARQFLTATPPTHRNFEWGYYVNRAWPPEDGKSGLPAPPAGKSAADIWDGVTARLLTTLEGHDGVVNTVRFHPDGRRVLTIASDRTSRLWEIETGKELKKFAMPPISSPSLCALDPAGRLMAAPHVDNAIAIWDIESGAIVRKLSGRTDSPNPLTFSPDGELLVSTALDRTYVVWDVASGARTNHLEAPAAVASDFLADAVFLAGTRTLAAAFPDDAVVIWNYDSGEIVRTIRGPRGAPFFVCRISPTGDTASSWAPETQAMIFWNTATGDELFSGTFGATGVVNPLEWAPDGSLALCRGDNRVWKVFRRGEYDPNPIRVSPIVGYYAGAFNGPGHFIALPEPEGPVRIYTPASESVSPEESITAHGDIAYTARYSHDGTLLVSAGFDGFVQIFDAHTLSTVRNFKAHEGEIISVVFSADDRYLLTFGNDFYVRVWDLANDSMAFETRCDVSGAFGGGVRGPAIRLASHFVSGEVFSPDGSRVALSTGRGEITVKKIPSGDVDYVARCDQEFSYKSGFSPDGRFLLNLPYQVDYLTLFDGRTGAVAAELRGHSGQIIDRWFSRDGSRIVTTGSDGTARIWDGRTGAPVSTIQVAPGGAFTGALSPDDSLLAVGCVEGFTALFRADSGARLSVFPGHFGFVTGISFSPDGQRLLTACMDNVTRIFNLEGDLLAELRLGDGERLYRTAWSPDGQSIVTTSSNGSVRVWRAVDWTAFNEPELSQVEFENHLAVVRGGS